MCALEALHFLSAFLLCRLANLISSFIHGTHDRLVVFLCLTGAWRSSREPNILSNKAANSSGSSVSIRKSLLLRISSINASLLNDRSFLNETRPTLRGGRAVFNLDSSARWSENKMSGAGRPQKKVQACTGFEPMTSGIPVQRSTNWANKPTGSRSWYEFFSGLIFTTA